jgi:hypothetical protein
MLITATKQKNEKRPRTAEEKFSANKSVALMRYWREE